jgi:hypothetical protein
LKADGTAAAARPRLRVNELNEHVPESALAPPLALRSKTIDPPLSPAAAAALHHFVALVPAEIRRMAAPLGDFQWLLLEAIHTVPGFEEFARTSIETRRAGFFIAVWCLAAAHTLPSGKRRELNRAIMTTPRRQLLERVHQKPFSATALSCIYKVEPTRLNAPLIRRIATVTADPVLRLRLAMTPRISPTLLDQLANIPEPLLHPGVLAALADIDDVECPYNVVAELTALTEQDHKSGGTSAIEALRRVRDAEGLVAAIARLKERIAAQKPFPMPPLGRSALLRPLLTVAELRCEARAMQNCVRTYGPAVQARHSYVCSWVGRERATVELVRGRGNQWTLGAFAGRNNRPLSIGTVLEIVTTLANDLRPKHGRTALGTKQEYNASRRALSPR